MSGRSIDVLHGLLMALYWAACLALWGTLPERIPHHFDLAGNPTSWGRTSIALWFGLPAMAFAMWLFVRGMLWLSLRNPALLNIPDKERYLALSAEQREPALAELRAAMAATAFFVTLSFAAIQVSVYETAVGRSDGLAPHVQLLLWAAIAGTVVAPLAYMPRVRRRIREAAHPDDAPDARDS
jgi:uncharacterized membrane protein